MGQVFVTNFRVTHSRSMAYVTCAICKSIFNVGFIYKTFAGN